MNTPQLVITNPPDRGIPQLVTARDLLECLEEKRKELLEDKWEIIENIIKAREKMEQFEADEIGKCRNLSQSSSLT